MAGEEGDDDGVKEGICAAYHACDGVVRHSSGGDVALRELVAVGEDGAGDGAELKEGSDSPDVVAPSGDLEVACQAFKGLGSGAEAIGGNRHASLVC